MHAPKANKKTANEIFNVDSSNSILLALEGQNTYPKR
jgi:hypothetical protein